MPYPFRHFPPPKLKGLKKPRSYSDPCEQNAYYEGHRDGFAGRDRKEDHPFPNAYSAGFWEGFAERKENAK